MTIIKIGDAHLGKRFEVGVPLHRRGERERMQMGQFRAELMAGGDLNIQMGDIFDKMVVPYAVIHETAQAYRDARAANPDTIYAVLRGNHDASRDVERVSAFDLLAQILQPMGVLVARDEPRFLYINYETHVLVPWHPVVTAAEMVEQHADKIAGAHAVYGHWDVVMGQENQIPSARLAELCGRAVTGHDHNKRELVMDGLDVEVVGSMQPYSHAEDPDGRLYVTKSLTEALTEDLRDKCVRVVLRPDEVLDQAIDCLQLTIQHADKDVVELGDVDFEAFDMGKLFEEARLAVELDEEFGAIALSRLEQERAARD